jgi:hypothetical protein
VIGAGGRFRRRARQRAAAEDEAEMARLAAMTVVHPSAEVLWLDSLYECFGDELAARFGLQKAALQYVGGGDA